MNADERLALVGLKIKRAEKHFIELQGARDAFLATKPYRVIKKVDPERAYKMAQVAPVPDWIGAIIGDAVHNLRSALDHITRQLVLVALGVDDTNLEPHFPNGDKAGQYESALRGMKQKGWLRDDAFHALLAVQAYKRGNGHQVWVLNRLNNIDKHRVILTTGASLRSFNLGAALSRIPWASYETAEGIRREMGTGRPVGTAHPVINLFMRPANIQCPLKVGDKLLVGGMELDPDNDFRFDIALNEPEIAERKPVLETLKHFADAVSGIVTTLRPCLE